MMLPFFLFSSLAGELADKMRKSRLLKLAKGAELGLMVVAAGLFYVGDWNSLLAALFLMGLQSTFFGPLKYGLLPEVLGESDLVAGNGLVEAATFLAIVLGALAGSWLGTLPNGPTLYLPMVLIAVAALGFFFALRQPESAAGLSDLKVNPAVWASTYAIIRSARSRQPLWLAILAVSWFWGVGAVLLTQIPALCREVVDAAPEVAVFLTTIFALGVGLGSLGVQRLLRGAVSLRLVPPTAALMCLFMTALAASVWLLPDRLALGGSSSPVPLAEFLGRWAYLRVGLGCFLVSVAGGVFVVPLNAFIQRQADVTERSRVIAANNIINALFICLASLIVIMMTRLGLGLAHIFIFIAATGAAVTLLTMYFLPGESLRQAAAVIVRVFFRPRVKGLENLQAAAVGPALVAANHTSFLDALLLIAYIPRRLTFAIDSYWARRWWLRPFLHAFKALPINPKEPLATRGLIEALNNGEMVVIFPEGRISSTGGLMKIYDGPALVAMRGRAPVVPAIIDGPQYGRFGRFGKRLPYRPKAGLKLTFLPPEKPRTYGEPGEKQKRQRHLAGEALHDLMKQSLFKATDYRQNMWSALREAARRYGPARPILEDAARRPASYRDLLRRARALGRRLCDFTDPGENVGLMLPNSVAALVGMFSLWAGGRVAVMMNFTQGAGALATAVKAARLKVVVTSRRFLDEAGLRETAEGLPVKLVYLEDLNLSLWDRLRGFFWTGRPSPAEAPAVVVFTSGSEGKPKGVVLSHINLMANIRQFRTQLDISEEDVFFNALPLFHVFGLTVGSLLPLMSGMRSLCYVSPLHTKLIPEIIYDARATVSLASDTFAYAWGKNAHPYDFVHMRIMIVGAEKLKARTRGLYFEKFGLRVLEGYGVSEAAPVLAVNTFMHFRAGSVGRLLPGLEARLAPVEGVSGGGRLQVKGPNVMLGYLRPEQPGVIVPPEDGWHDTGDIVEIDSEGFVWIRGRFKRFAKVAGEMVSLVAVEEVAAALWPGRPQALVAMDDEQKGEKLVLATEDPAPDLPLLWQALKEAGMPEISYPRQFVYLPEIPLTQVGKINLPKLIELVRVAMSNAS
jgi:acyl-[acyl-carrier-protein]-phospholipid O-acyltransferase/long-chain-fatty-acid--[acyl-carrier-protein] ligase